MATFQINYDLIHITNGRQPLRSASDASAELHARGTVSLKEAILTRVYNSEKKKKPNIKPATYVTQY